MQVAKAEILRLIYQGRFLHGNVTLSALGLPTGKTAVMHLVSRYISTRSTSAGNYSVSKGSVYWYFLLQQQH